ncbi:hypothetical protein CAEBREN_24611 [Caenorhabditis brenneri]|uniref:Uncharacterized protein n=1 Tax=Caenorhabditis brenneri TaxID=135651 RepID=G0NP72_CAEBE|nr:hypothetical protein CAEBREN_24611 [Caenorhabditis brenneri]
MLLSLTWPIIYHNIIIVGMYSKKIFFGTKIPKEIPSLSQTLFPTAVKKRMERKLREKGSNKKKIGKWPPQFPKMTDRTARQAVRSEILFAF